MQTFHVDFNEADGDTTAPTFPMCTLAKHGSRLAFVGQHAILRQPGELKALGRVTRVEPNGVVHVEVDRATLQPDR